ncbi:MAG: hypothetical protein DMF94_11750 [Acidobacteria bacterium]|nr:MAG: hypothetical protein DMF94_11750 [Acidobacteriota bacterium]
MHRTPRLLDVVALFSDLPAHGLLRGQVGTVVDLLDAMKQPTPICRGRLRSAFAASSFHRSSLGRTGTRPPSR